MNASPETIHKPARLANGLVAGAILILVGLSALLQNLFHLDTNGLFLIAAIFLAAGILSRRTGLLVPGGIIAGVALGVTLESSAGLERGGLILLSLAGGFALISLLSVYTEGPANWRRWPLFPAAATALVGGALLSGQPGLLVLQTLGYIWPVFLILGGLALILGKK